MADWVDTAARLHNATVRADSLALELCQLKATAAAMHSQGASPRVAVATEASNRPGSRRGGAMGGTGSMPQQAPASAPPLASRATALQEHRHYNPTENYPERETVTALHPARDAPALREALDSERARANVLEASLARALEDSRGRTASEAAAGRAHAAAKAAVEESRVVEVASAVQSAVLREREEWRTQVRVTGRRDAPRGESGGLQSRAFSPYSAQ